MNPNTNNIDRALKELERRFQPTLSQRIFSALVGMMIFTIFAGVFVWAVHQLALFFTG